MGSPFHRDQLHPPRDRHGAAALFVRDSHWLRCAHHRRGRKCGDRGTQWRSDLGAAILVRRSQIPYPKGIRLLALCPKRSRDSIHHAIRLRDTVRHRRAGPRFWVPPPSRLGNGVELRSSSALARAGRRTGSHARAKHCSLDREGCARLHLAVSRDRAEASRAGRRDRPLRTGRGICFPRSHIRHWGCGLGDRARAGADRCARSPSAPRTEQRTRDRAGPGDQRPDPRARWRTVSADHPGRRDGRARRRCVSLLLPIAGCTQLPSESACEVSSIYRQALGSEFDRLHPQIQRRFGFSSEDGCAAIGRGVMERVWHGLPYTLPFLYVGTWRRIMFPQHGRDVPFSVHNYAYRDRLGRETVTWNRDFAAPLRRRFDATMIYSERRGRIVDYLGTHQHLAVDIDLSVDERGGMHVRSAAQRFYEGPFAFDFPMLFSGYADVHEWFDDESEDFRISVRVTNPVWGPLFGYEGRFRVEWIPCRPGDVPADMRPRREELRE